MSLMPIRHIVALTASFTLLLHALPEEFAIQDFAAPPNAEYPTAITVSPNGDVYVSSDRNGSLGKKEDMGRIIRCRDTDGDGRADDFIDFVPSVSSPRGGHIVGDTLYLIHPPYLSAFRDADGDGVAEEKTTLVKGFGGGIEHPRGADHTTNGVRMGIDGWLYVSVGDFGMAEARGADGTTYTLHGGGVVRVRPDGSEMEPYALMVRNICDTAISPSLDLFSRDNTNDGKGWNTRFHHYTALGDHGYPRLYQNFAEEAITPLADYGGGSGTGALWVSEPGFPGTFGEMLYSCDWTTGNVYYHPSRRVGASYEIEQKVFHPVGRAIDIDVDGFSRLYIADWRGGRFNFAGPGKPVGMIQIVTPRDRSKAASYVDPGTVKGVSLVNLLASPSAVQRFFAQREILKVGDTGKTSAAVLELAKQASQPEEVRAAAIFTYKQLLGATANKPLLELVGDEAVREYVLRAVTDRKTELDGVPVAIYEKYLADPNPRVVLQAMVGLERMGAGDSTASIFEASRKWNDQGVSPRLRHTAVAVLASLANVEVLLDFAKKAGVSSLALDALQKLHRADVVTGLVALSKSGDDPEIRFGALSALARLYFKEKPWDLKSWWRTRPDDRGPYFETVEWDETARIREVLEQSFADLNEEQKREYLTVLSLNRLPVSQLQLKGMDALMAALGTPVPTDGQIALLADAAMDSKREFSQRVSCYRAIARIQPAKKMLLPKLKILAAWLDERDVPSEANQMIDDFVNDTQRGLELGDLRKAAAKEGESVSRIAWRAQLTMLNSPIAKDQWKKQVRKAVDGNPMGAGFFLALADLGLTGFDKQINAAIASDNAGVAAAARKAREMAGQSAAGGKRVAEMSRAEVFEAAMKGKGDAAAGKRFFTSQGCIACHAVDPKAEQKGPYLGSAGSKFTRDYLIDSILEPDKVVAQGFRTSLLSMKDGKAHLGFITGEEDGVVEIRNIAGQVTKVKRSDVKTEQEMPQSMMPPGLGDSLDVQDFTSLIDYLVSLKSAEK